MRDVNFFSVLNNKATANMTPTLYDRRALDCPFDRPLVNSLSSLCVLVSSSQLIRESLATDGGIDRLITILKSCEGMHSKDLLTSWKWSLALQCLSSVGVRGSEAVRRRVVEADIVPILATVLDNFLEAVEKVRMYHDFFVNQPSPHSQASVFDARHPSFPLMGPAAPIVSRRRQTTQDNDSEQEQTGPGRPQEPMFDSGIDVNAADMFVTMMGAAVATTEEQQRQVAQQEEDLGQASREANTGAQPTADTAEANTAYISRLHHHLYHHHRHHHRHHHSHSHSHSYSHTQSTHSSPSASTSGVMSPTAVTATEPGLADIPSDSVTSGAADTASAMEIDDAPQDIMTSSVSSQVATDADDIHNSSSDEVQYSESSSYTADIAPRIIDMDYTAEYRDVLQRENAAESTASSVFDVAQSSADSEPVTSNDRPSPPSVRTQLSPLFGAASAPSAPASQTEPSPVQAAPQTESIPGVSPSSLSIPAFLGSQDNLPREDDVLMSLQLLAYVSKYVCLRPYFQNTHIVPCLSTRTDIRSQMSSTPSDAGLDNPALVPEDESLIAPEYKLSTLNLFQLVERFTTRMFVGDLHYWASVIMRNSCRKDESRGGVRQCGYFECGKWEEYPKQFAKCRRCRRTKYCSKNCQSKAWFFHRHWCVPPE
ncbi:hypothetical protein V1522DRAFT_8521 [Lipomyces starkeyi]